jgi:hypothetical protein
MSQGLRVGDRVRWIGPGSSHHKNAVGTIIDIKPSALGNPGLAVFEVMFEFEVWYVFGDQIELADS